MLKKVLVTGLMFTVMVVAAACGKEPERDSEGASNTPVWSSEVEAQPEEETKASTAGDSQPTEEAKEETVCSYIFSDMPIAAFEITGLGVGLDVPVRNEPIIFDENDSEFLPLVQLTPGENTFVLYCFSGGSDSDEGWRYGISRARVYSPSGSSQWEANCYIVSPDGLSKEFVPEGWAWMEKFYGKFSEQNAGSQEIVSDGLIVNVDETCNGQFESLIDPWGHYIRFSEIFHSEASRSDVIHVVEAVTWTGGDDYEVEENVVSAMVAAFEERGATVQEVSVEEALAKDNIIVSEEGAE